MGITFLLWLTVNILTATRANLSSKLRNYDVITVEERHLHKRSLDTNFKEDLNISALGRNFKLTVWPARDILDGSFRTVLVSSDGTLDQVDYIDHDEVLHGTVKGCDHSGVRLIRTEHGPLGSFFCNDEEFHLEPAVLHDEGASERETLLYRASDVVPSLHAPIDYPLWTKGDNLEVVNDKHEATVSRRRRDVSEPVEKNRCAMKIVADTTFYRTAGQGKLAFTSRYIVNLYDRINQIFTKTDFGQDSTGQQLVNLGFMIKEIVILETYNTSSRNHYNAKTEERSKAQRILDSFTSLEESRDFCLVQLITARKFEDSALGLAFIGTAAPGAGICPQTSPKAYNTLLTSVMSTSGSNLLVTREADIVLAHELGHSWGATHDQDMCLPKDSRDYYIMTSHAVSGYDPNNLKFSDCSRSMMKRVLSNRADDCFIPQQTALCGNGILEEGEQCDEGFIVPGLLQGRCCTRECKLFAGAQCSQRNHPCCSPTCVFLPAVHICRHRNFLQCSMQSNCTGFDGECPPPKPTPDGSLCLDGGECRNGTCLPFCERTEIGKKSCICTDEENACRRCCREANSSQCMPEPRGGSLRDGTFCVHGTCEKEKCVREVVDVMSHFLGLLEGVDRSNWEQFFKSNIAGIIIFFSLVIWIPASCCIFRWDKPGKSDIGIRKAGVPVNIT